jgi:hypothetical protein
VAEVPKSMHFDFISFHLPHSQQPGGGGRAKIVILGLVLRAVCILVIHLKGASSNLSKK